MGEGCVQVTGDGGGCGLDIPEDSFDTTYVFVEDIHVRDQILQARSQGLRDALLDSLLLIGLDLLPQRLDALGEYLLPVGFDLLSELCEPVINTCVDFLDRLPRLLQVDLHSVCNLGKL